MDSVPKVSSAVVALACIAMAPAALAQDLPVLNPASEGHDEIEYAIRNVFSEDDLHACITGGEEGLTLDLIDADPEMPGVDIDPSLIYGRAYIGPYPFEAAETTLDYRRFRTSAGIDEGKATLPVGYLLTSGHNSEDWIDEGRVAVRLDLMLESETGRDAPLGMYDLFVSFRQTGDGFERVPFLLEGPFVCVVSSDEPDALIIRYETDVPAETAVVLTDSGRTFESEGKVHEVVIDGLEASTTYGYIVEVADTQTKPMQFTTAPPRGTDQIVFAYTGDSREGGYGGESSFMGVNQKTLERIAAVAYQQGAQFLVQGGDLFNGYTTSPEDFRTQFYSWKQGVSGFWHTRPVYTAMGNHEALLRVFQTPSTVRLDRWPYDTESAEAVFADELSQFTNGPEPSDPRRPTYRESVYSFQYGNVLMLCYNNNYWYTNSHDRFGGCPQGYLFEDQLEWIEGQLEAAEEDATIDHVFLMAQEPVFPCGGHTGDAMWYSGDNNVRAHVYTDGELVPEELGIIEVRDRFVRAITGSTKVAAVLGSDEHAYYRILINQNVPVGDLSRDDEDGDGVLDDASPVDWIENPTWFITSGGAGAPYYSEEPAPWNEYWNAMGGDGYYFSSQENVIIFRVDGESVEAVVYNPSGEVIDTIDDLAAVKR